MGRVTVEAKVENLKDIWAVEQELLEPDGARCVIIPDVLVDAGATTFSLPANVLAQLGLKKTGEKPVRTSAGKRTAPV